MKKFSISKSSLEEKSVSSSELVAAGGNNRNLSPNKMALKSGKEAGLYFSPTIATKTRSFYSIGNYQFTKSFPVLDENLSQEFVLENSREVNDSRDKAFNINHRFENIIDNNEIPSDELILKMNDFQPRLGNGAGVNSKEAYLSNKMDSQQNREDKDGKNNRENNNKAEENNIEQEKSLTKAQKINLKKHTLLTDIFNSINLEGKYQKILFFILAFSSFICSMLITSYPLQKEIPNYECVDINTFDPNSFKKFRYKKIENVDCIVKFCLLKNHNKNSEVNAHSQIKGTDEENTDRDFINNSAENYEGKYMLMK